MKAIVNKFEVVEVINIRQLQWFGGLHLKT